MQLVRPKRRTLVLATVFGVLIVGVLGALLARMASSDDAVRWRSSERVAFDGTNYFVVWVEYGDAEGIYGARVSEDGAVLDQPPISISTEGTGEGDPRVAFNGTNYLVAWTDSRDAIIGDAWDAYAARVSPAGKVLDRTGIPITTVENDQQVGGVASDGTNFLVVWDGVDARTDEYTIRGARIDDAGKVLDPEGFSISKGEEEQITPSIGFDGTNYLVAWQDSRGWPNSNIYGTRVSKAGKVIDPAAIAISGSPKVLNGPSITAGDDQYLVTWTHLRDDFNYDVWGARVSGEGAVLDSEGLLIGFAPKHQWLPSAAFDGTNYLVAWEDLRRGNDTAYVYSTRVSRTGDVLEPVGMTISKAMPVQAMPSVGFGDENYLATWMEARDDSGDVSDIYAVRVDKDGEVIDRPPIAVSTMRSR
jgi:hypothetical protein